MAFLLLAIGYLKPNAAGSANPPVISAGGFFALLAAFMAWYNALAGILDDSNRYDQFHDAECLIEEAYANSQHVASSLSRSRISPGLKREWRSVESLIRTIPSKCFDLFSLRYPGIRSRQVNGSLQWNCARSFCCVWSLSLSYAIEDGKVSQSWI